MLNRRYLRIKVMQALYSFFQSDNKDLVKAERDMMSSIEKMYDLYIYLLQLMVEIKFFAEKNLEDGKSKHRPTSEDLIANEKFLNNPVLKKISENLQLKKEVSNRKVTWQTEGELVKKIFQAIKNSEEYSTYMTAAATNFSAEKKIIIEIYKKYVCNFELLHHFFEERSIFWVDDIDYVHTMAIKTLESFNENLSENTPLASLYKDEEDDKKFVVDLFRKTILHDEENQDYIAKKTKNWEIERIAIMDTLLMKMAITELMHFPSVPVKVSLNEYIELSKQYSTPKSKIFINGILDKLVAEFESGNKIAKTGRGLME